MATGRSVTRFAPGEPVFAFTGAGYGCHAAFRTLPETALIQRKPAALTDEMAAALCFGGTTALVFLRDKGRVQPGERVLIVGASGCVASAAIQLARHFGAHVTGVCGRPGSRPGSRPATSAAASCCGSADASPGCP